MEEPMKYLLLIYHNPGSREVWESFSEEQQAEGLQAYAALNESLAASGELIVSEALADQSQATRVSVNDGQAMTSDGPFAEVKEQLAGFYLVECEDMDRAGAIAALIPEVSAGAARVEVRPILTYSGLEM
jgi:hypothetical protein